MWFFFVALYQGAFRVLALLIFIKLFTEIFLNLQENFKIKGRLVACVYKSLFLNLTIFWFGLNWGWFEVDLRLIWDWFKWLEVDLGVDLGLIWGWFGVDLGLIWGWMYKKANIYFINFYNISNLNFKFITR